MSECPCPKHPFGCYRHPKECGCSPDPTRSALEELARTLKCTNGEHAWSLHGRSGNEPAYICGRCATVWSNSRIMAYATARNALGTEK